MAKRPRNNEAPEALEWLRGSGPASYRYLAEYPNEQSIELIEQLYAVGARRVSAVKFDVNPPYESINTLKIDLPDEADARQRVFEWINEKTVLQGYDPDEDTGQGSVSLWFD
jgi:hypothetical protein